MKIDAQKLIDSGNSELVDMEAMHLGTLSFPSGAMAILEPMTYFTHIDQEIAARRIEVPGPATVMAIIAAVGNLDARPFGIVLGFSTATATVARTVGEISVDVARIMFADAGLLADKWVRDEDGYAASQQVSLDDAIAGGLLSFRPISEAEKLGGSQMLLTDTILTSLTGWGDGVFQIVRHDDANGNLVRVVVTFLGDECDRPIDFLDFDIPAQTATVVDKAGFQDFTFDPYASRRKIVENDDGTLTLSVNTRTGTGRDMPGPITVPAHLAEEVKECMYSCGEAVIGKAKMTGDRLVMQLVFQSALWTDMRGNWFDYETLDPVDMYGAPLKAAA